MGFRLQASGFRIVVAATCLVLAAAGPVRAQVPAFEKYEKGKGAFANAKENESCLSCHHREAPPAPPAGEQEERREVVVVGAGLAGLTAAYKLRDRDVLILEKDPRPGGKIKRETWEGIRYSQGAAYLVEPAGDTKALLDELKLEPVKIADPETAMFVDGKLVKDPWTAGVDDLPFSKEAKERLKTAFKEVAELADEVSVPARDSPERLLELDRVPAVDYFGQYGEELVRMMRPYIRNCFAIDIDEVSALGALIYLACEFAPIYSFPGGLAEVTDALAAALGERARFGCYVVEVAADKDGVRVLYRDPHGKMKAVRARAAVVAIPQNAAKYIVKGLSDERKALMGRVFHGAYAAAAIKTAKPLWNEAYDTWLLDSPVTDVTVADWVVHGGKPGKGKGILNANMPLGISGRADLLAKPIDAIKREFLDALEPRIPGLKENLVDIEVFFYGHAMHVAFPGFVTEVSGKLAEPVAGRIFFAGAELDLPCFESAIWSGFDAAKQVRKTVLAAR